MRKFFLINFFILAALICTVIIPSAASARDQGDDAIRLLVADLEGEIEIIRGLKYLKGVDSKLVSDQELVEYLKGEIEEQVTPEREHAILQVYGQLGIIPRDKGFVETYEALLEDQAGGIYDPDGNQLFVVASNLPGLGDDGNIDNTGMMGLLGVDPTMLVKMVLAHELCHALEDQHFQFNDKFEEILKESSSDKESAIQCLVEGSATRLMIDYISGGAPMTALQRTLNRLMTNLLSEITIKVPKYYKKTLTSPYVNGEIFVSYIMANNDWSSINAAYLNPPESMEQILHPAKYKKDPDHPSNIVLADFTDVLGDGYTELMQDTFGEFVIDILFDIHLPREEFKTAPPGWDGDRIVGYEDADGEVTLIWHTVWDSPEDAGQFSDAMRSYLSVREEKLHQTESKDGPSAGLRKYTNPLGREFMIVHDENDVIFIDNAPWGSADDLYMLVLEEDQVDYNL